MKQVVSYSVKLKMAKASAEVLKQTCDVYRNAVAYIVSFLPPYWDSVKAKTYANEQMMYVETLIHSTKDRKAVCDFDQKFYKLPSYMRRAAIFAAIGMYSSWKSNHDNWENAGHKGKEPVMGTTRNLCPAFFRGNTFQMISDDTALVKVFAHHDWIWMPVRMNHSDLKYIRKKISEGWLCGAPVIEKRYGHYEMRFAMQRTNMLNETPVLDQKICAVDLGITADAACCIMDSHGTILARKFISCGREKDLTEKMLRRVKEFQRLHGSHDSGILWHLARNRNLNHAHLIAHRIVELALEYQCDVIVFEHLNTKGKKHGSKKQKLAMWNHQTVQNTAESLAHQYGMRVSHICAWNTSRLAYDGSGEVLRGRKAFRTTPYDMCLFTTGKLYNCDLNASYNIGARYFLRAMLKDLPNTAAEDLGIGSGTQRTLADLWKLNPAPVNP